MDKINIYIADNSFEANLIAEKAKEFRRDVFVRIDQNYYKIIVRSLNNFLQNIKQQYQNCGKYIVESHCLIVEKVSKKCIISTVLKEAEMGYFNKLKSCPVQDKEIFYLLDSETTKCFIKNNIPISIKIDKLTQIY